MENRKTTEQLVTEAIQGSKDAELDELGRLSAIYRSMPPSDFDFVSTLKDMHQSGLYRIISDPRVT